MHPLTYWLCKSQFSDPYSKIRLKNPRIDDICNDYEKSLVGCVKYFGLEVKTFNKLTDEVISEGKALKRKVKLQAMQYHLAASLPQELIETIDVRDSIPPSRHQIMEDRKKKSKILLTEDKRMIFKFSKALHEVESERNTVRRNLQNRLGIRSLPRSMCSPDVLPAMSSIIQQACTEFPRKANKIIANNGLSLFDFDILLERTQYDLFYRAHVNYHIGRLKRNPGGFDGKN